MPNHVFNEYTFISDNSKNGNKQIKDLTKYLKSLPRSFLPDHQSNLAHHIIPSPEKWDCDWCNKNWGTGS